MCGIAGYYLTNKTESSAEQILRMVRSLAHRGPDDEGVTLFRIAPSWSINLTTTESSRGVTTGQVLSGRGDGLSHQIAFGHRRFSIIDLSPSGHQPFWSHNLQACVCFNGEIYNYLEIRQELTKLGHEFHTRSDTEVLIEAYLEWDVECFKHFDGFWALSLFDARKSALLLSRDRIGKAPLYIAGTSEGVYLGSEIKCLWAVFGSAAFPVRDQAVSDFVFHGWRDHGYSTFYKGIVSFPNASYAWLSPDGSYQPTTFWELPKRRLRESEISASEATSELHSRLTKAVKLRLRADVPVGFELSGGTDSSALTALAAQLTDTIRTYTVSFPGTPYDEEVFARQVSQRYSKQIDYTVLLPPEEEFFERADSYVWLMEEPFHSPNLLTNQGVWLQMAQRRIRVSINGAGGDEVFAGYPADYHTPYLRWLLQHGRMLKFAREFILFTDGLPSHFGIRALRQVCQFLPDRLRGLYRRHKRPTRLDAFRTATDAIPPSGPASEIQQRLIDNMGNWRMNYWMRSGNKSAMGVPLEVRAPFLDYHVVDFAFTLPLSFLIRDGWMKWILRQTMKDSLPAEVVWRRRKMGFPFPLVHWLVESKERILPMLAPLDCPYVDFEILRTSYSEMCAQNADSFWRLLSVALWWKRCVVGETLL